MDSHSRSEPFWPSLPGTGMSNINFLTAGVIKLLSNAEITFSQEGATDLPKKYLVPGLCTLNHRMPNLYNSSLQYYNNVLLI